MEPGGSIVGGMLKGDVDERIRIERVIPHQIRYVQLHRDEVIQSILGNRMHRALKSPWVNDDPIEARKSYELTRHPLTPLIMSVEE